MAIEYELTKSTKEHAGSLGKNSENTTAIVGQRFTPADLKQYNYTDFYLDSISFRCGVPATYKIRVWCGPEGSEMDIYSQDYEVTDTTRWASVRLDNPVLIDPSKSYIIGYEVTPKSGEYACSYDGGPVVEGGNLIYDYSSTDKMYIWSRLDELSGIKGNWEISGHFTDSPDAATSKDDNVSYDIWRLKATDRNATDKWTKLTDKPVKETAYEDKTWKDQTDADYLYAVKSVFFDNIEAEPVFSKMLEKGKVSLVTVNVTTVNGDKSVGASVELTDGKNLYKATTGEDGSCKLVEVRKGSYTINVSKEGFGNYSASVDLKNGFETISAVLDEEKNAPVYAKAESLDGNEAVNVTWRAPGSYAPTEGWVYWDSNDILGGMGSNTGQISVGQLFTTEDQVTKGMKELSVSKISFYVNNTDDDKGTDPKWTVKVWRVLQSGVEEACSQEVDNVEFGKWNEVQLTTSYYISGNEALLIGYEYKGSGRVIGIDRGPAVAQRGDWGQHRKRMGCVQPGCKS